MLRIVNRVARSMHAPQIMQAPKRISMPSRSFATVDPRVTNHKLTTNITGLDVIPNAREVLISIYDATIQKAEEYNKINGQQHHNNLVIQICKFRRSLAERSHDVKQIEEDARLGNIETMVEEAEDEYNLLVAMNEVMKPWGPDPLGEEQVKDYHADFGERPDQHVKNWAPTDEAETFNEFDEIVGLKQPAAETLATPSQSS